MSRKIFKILFLILFTIVCRVSYTQALLDGENLKFYTELYYTLDCRQEIPNTFFATPFTTENIYAKIDEHLRSANIKLIKLPNDTKYPILKIIVFPPVVLGNAETAVKAFQIDTRVFDFIDGKEVIIYYGSYDFVIVNGGNDSAANDSYKYLDMLLNEFTESWAQEH